MVSYIVKRGKLCHFYAYLYTSTNLEEGDNLVTIPEKYAPSDIALLTMRYLAGITYIDGRGAYNAKKSYVKFDKQRHVSLGFVNEGSSIMVDTMYFTD